MKAGHKALKTNPLAFKFKPDHGGAAIEFTQAATAFQAAGNPDSCIEAWRLAAQMREHDSDFFLAGRALEAVGTLYEKEKRNPAAAIPEWRKASQFFRLCGKDDIAVKLWLKMAEHSASPAVSKPDDADALYSECIEVYETAEQFHYAAEVYRTYINFLAKQRRLEKLTKTIKEYMKLLKKLKQTNHLAKMTLSLVVLFLAQDNQVAADDALSDGIADDTHFLGTPEFEQGSLAVEAYKGGDDEALKKTVAAQTFAFLPVEIAKIARGLKIESADFPGRGPSGAKKERTTGGAASAPGRGGAGGLFDIPAEYRKKKEEKREDPAGARGVDGEGEEEDPSGFFSLNPGVAGGAGGENKEEVIPHADPPIPKASGASHEGEGEDELWPSQQQTGKGGSTVKDSQPPVESYPSYPEEEEGEEEEEEDDPFDLNPSKKGKGKGEAAGGGKGGFTGGRGGADLC
uniref:Gamma-soluble NSF attachment protein n=1 Tax=Chromera velia CCMP2878 TaxID=1169474 RepID=A0A0G4FYS7_9ALVE|eukprot:Cvel_19440.t1-p1 / transcript=Cvel_19440.t1 / gene=Cvel_19440 / organism=Chromera_velia_CCMP2878 / gene_product=Gamma-soluble NSF attachment protein, putative / transcript_product=Gamma-soluble NSF attachment protein, putative / location=Cvel_scaffold1676:1347-3984(-) / protein_length=458 / sequence_SO=supercontig / SO=protein_coding / is_pseudo=false